MKTLISLAVLVISIEAQASYFDDVEYARLATELGATIPDGTGVAVAQAEADSNGDPDIIAYAPDSGVAQFAGRTIIDETGITGFFSSHATGVGIMFFGSLSSTTPGIGIFQSPAISSYWADDWLTTGFLQGGQIALPSIKQTRVTNHSWVGSFPDDAQNLEILRRVDWLAATDESIQVAGFRASSPLLGSAYNAITVTETGRRISSGSASVQGDPTYSVTHSRPDLVAPGNSTSNATPRVSSAVALLIDTAHSDPSLSNGSTTNRNGNVIYNAERSEVVKAALMAGADRVTRNTTDDDITDYRLNISDQTDNGLDRRYGAGQINIYHGYQIVVAGEQDSDQDDHGSGTGQIGIYGYDYDSAFGGQGGSNSEATYFFWTGVDDVEFISALVWNVVIDPGPSSDFNQSAVLYDLDLELYEAVDPGNSSTWVSIDQSKSASENTENLRVFLLPGKYYALRVTVGAGQAAFNSDYALAWQVKAVIDAPDVVGQPQATAEANIVAAGLVVGTTAFAIDGTVGIGNVIGQIPIAGASVEPGSVVNLAISLGPDDDNDGIPNASDNCVAVANGPNDTVVAGPSQNDTDLDGYGNMCDADLDNTLAVNFSDLSLFKAVFNTTDPDADLNGDMTVNFSDLYIFKTLFNKPPGPSGVMP